MKPVLYGSIAARFITRPRVLNALAGMGWLFTPGTWAARGPKALVSWGLSRVLKTGVTIVQNPDDARLLSELGVPAARIQRIPGSGVDLNVFQPQSPPVGTPVIVLPSRLLWQKGVGEFVAAARILRRRGVEARFVLAGDPDPANPSTIPADQIQKWVSEGVVEHLGWVNDMPSLLAAC